MKSFIVKTVAVLAMITAFAACKSDKNVTTYGGNDSDEDYVTMVLYSDNSTYELYYGESKSDKNYEEFSKGTYEYKNNGTILFCADNDGKTTFSITVNGSTLVYDNGLPEPDHYAFKLKKK